MVNAAVLDEVPFLRGVDHATKRALAARAVLRRYARGRRLWEAGAPSEGLFLVLAGHVRVVRFGRRLTQTVHVEGPGATLGEVPFFAGGTYPATAVAAEPTTCLVLERQAVASVMRTHPDLAWVLLERLATRLRLLIDRLSAQGSDPVMVRLAAYLLARQRNPDGSCTLGLTQQALAEELGTAREVVVRSLARLLAAGVISRERRGVYVVRDVPGLRQLAAGRAR